MLSRQALRRRARYRLGPLLGDLRRPFLLFVVAGFKMWRAAFAKWWEPQKIYYTKVFQELYVGLAVTGYIFYKISYGGKKKVADKPASAHH